MAKTAGEGGAQKGQVRLSDSVLRKVIDGYAREAGVRILDQLLGRIVRKAVVQFLEKDLSKITISH